MRRSQQDGRHDVLSYLANNGGVISDPAGRAAVLMREALGYQTHRGFLLLLTPMVEEGLVTRNLYGRRTRSIEITDAGREWLTKPRVYTAPVRKAPAKLAVNYEPPKTKVKYHFPEGGWERRPVDHDEVCRSQARSMKWMDLAS